MKGFSKSRMRWKQRQRNKEKKRPESLCYVALKYFNYMTHMCALMMLILMMIWQCSHKNDNKCAMRTHPDPEENTKQTFLQIMLIALYAVFFFTSSVATLSLSCASARSVSLRFFCCSIWTCLHCALLLSFVLLTSIPITHAIHTKATLTERTLARNSWNIRPRIPIEFLVHVNECYTHLSCAHIQHNTNDKPREREFNVVFFFCLSRWTITNDAITTRMSHAREYIWAFRSNGRSVNDLYHFV